jgi:hypothetical protein
MRKTLFALVGASSMLFATHALALCSNAGGTVGGAAAGAVTGAIVGGPVGAAVGGVIGGAAGSQLPPTACSYVVTQQVPTVKYEKQIVVGEPLPATVQLHAIPDTQTYVFASVNDRRVLVDPKTRVVVEVIN